MPALPNDEPNVPIVMPTPRREVNLAPQKTIM